MLKSKLEKIEGILNGKIKLQHRIPDYNYGLAEYHVVYIIATKFTT